MSAPLPRNVIVRTPSWGPQTFHLGPISVWELHRGDAARCGCEPLSLSDLVAPLEEGRGVRVEGHGCDVTYRVEPLLD